jgi:hypothetical protein
MTDLREPYRGDEEVEEVVRKFESCEFSPEEFKHQRHLTVALFYLLRSTEAEATEHMRRGLERFLQAHGIRQGVYHETLTIFWMKRVRAFVGHAGAGRGLADIANELLAECGDPRLVFDYYSKELIDSERARAGWVEPDLRPRDF